MKIEITKEQYDKLNAITINSHRIDLAYEMGLIEEGDMHGYGVSYQKLYDEGNKFYFYYETYKNLGS